MLMSACGSSDGSGAGAGAGGSGGMGGMGGVPPGGMGGGFQDMLEYRPCSDSDRVGRFAISSESAEQNAARETSVTSVNGEVFDKVDPSDVWVEVMSSEQCQLLVGPDLQCNPRCSSVEACTPEGGCVEQPTGQDVGTVTVDGLGVELAMSPNSVNRYNPGSVDVGYMPYEVGATITLQAPGGSYEPLRLHARGVSELSVPHEEISVASGEPTELRWQASEASNAVRMHIELDIAHHGGVAARIECDVEDTGSFEIPAELVTGLVDRGVAGFPAVVLRRRSIDSQDLEHGCVELEVGSEVVREVTVPGLTSCSADQPCPEGMTCRTSDLTCVES